MLVSWAIIAVAKVRKVARRTNILRNGYDGAMSSKGGVENTKDPSSSTKGFYTSPQSPIISSLSRTRLVIGYYAEVVRNFPIGRLRKNLGGKGCIINNHLMVELQ